ncbi:MULTISPECIES: peptidoglycan recognition protein [unclassified Streptomyces]|uniref:peptidoglycan recognition protein family protein n=1 Tax=unclassified Streptomyces TaxID=2593676 RepID=UPI0006B04C44|nr:MULTISPECIES: peptidoglycan recognition protein [unclassified Streptomyces]KOX19464.1 N-acetylmuramoyl-L-alanine amidase [Streptomyces sp. NRRL F-6491]KOX48297.1 N-acetylmuramoyl-L-alanine amidase [Streptomyces sp. NRRL F-6492]
MWGTAATAVAGLAGVLVFQGMTGDNGAPTGTDGKATTGPVSTRERTAPLATGAHSRSASLGRRDTEPFSMLGVTWTDPGARVTGAVEVRTRAAGSGKWSGWLRLDGDSGQGETGAVRGGTEPAWVGPSDGVEVRVASGGKTSTRLPAGLRLDMVDPGTGNVKAMAPAAFAREATAEPTPSDTDSTPPAPEATPTPDSSTSGTPSTEPTTSAPTTDVPTPTTETPSASPSSATPSPSTASPSPSTTSPTPSASATATLPPAPPSTAPRPPVTSRAGWGADETISPEEPGYLPGGGIKAVVVHHTAESNTYTCADAPKVVRGIYAYHVKQLGWKDIGYNFLVDKCGTVYEGRKGGVDRPVQGAHAYGFNAETTGISVLGTYTDAAPSQAAMTSVARIAAWKLGQYGVDPAGTTTLTAGDKGTDYFGRSWAKGAQMPFPVIHGHRDGYNTQCPGNAFYGRLGTLRTWAAGPVTGLTVTSVTGASLSGTTYYTKAGVTLGWASTTPTSLVKQYELLVDGKPAATAAGTATSAMTTLVPGTHSVAVRATHISGRQTTSPAVIVAAETTAPAFTTKPTLSLRTGTVNTTAVPVTLNWKAADNNALKDVRLTAPVIGTYGPTVTSSAHTAGSGTATTWSMTAYDRAGNTTGASVSATPVILQETAAVKTGTWTAKSSTSYLGGRSLTSSSANASLTWTFTGRSAAWTVSRASTSGQAHIYVDGVKAATVDLKSSTAKYRDAIWTKTWATSAKHTVKVVVAGTAGRPALTTDGLVYLK